MVRGDPDSVSPDRVNREKRLAMDPNAALADIRDLLTALDADPKRHFAVEELNEKFTALDGWLSKGGFLPREWEKAGK